MRAGGGCPDDPGCVLRSGRLTVVASAPGKLVLLGEYAVLEGAPATVAAVDRRARVRLRPAPDECYTVSSPTLEITAATFRLHDGAVEWTRAVDAEQLGLVETVLQALDEKPRPFHATLGTGRFQYREGRRRAKLGLGSSAALTVALAGALSRLNDTRPEPERLLPRLLQAHGQFQSGRGSGLDLAAALYGGTIAYTLPGEGRQPEVESLALPDGLYMLHVWSGRSASTPRLLAALEDWRVQFPGRYRHNMRALAAIAETGARSIRRNDATGLIEAVDEYARALAELGRASGLDIVSAEHGEIAALAQAEGASYKPSGAGGGDLGIAIAREPGRLANLRQRLTQHGFATIDLGLETAGLRTRTTQ